MPNEKKGIFVFRNVCTTPYLSWTAVAYTVQLIIFVLEVMPE